MKIAFWTSPICPPFGYRSSNFAITIVDALNLFANVKNVAKKIRSDIFTRSNRDNSNIAIIMLENEQYNDIVHHKLVRILGAPIFFRPKL